MGGKCSSLGSSEAFKGGVGSLQRSSYELHVLCKTPGDNVDAVIAYINNKTGSSGSSGDDANAKTAKRVAKAVNASDPMGFTPLLCAIAAGNYHISKHLIGCGANIGITVDNKIISTSTILLAVIGGHKDIVTLLLKELTHLKTNPVGPTTDPDTAINSIFTSLLNYKDNHNKNALAYAVDNIPSHKSSNSDNNKAFAIIKLLVGSCISLDEVDSLGNTALASCVLSYISKDEVRREKMKQQPHSKNIKLTALIDTYKELTFFLLDNGANCNIININSGKSALVTAAEAGLFDVCCKMAECGGDVSAKPGYEGGKCCLEHFSGEQAETLKGAAAGCVTLGPGGCAL